MNRSIEQIVEYKTLVALLEKIWAREAAIVVHPVGFSLAPRRSLYKSVTRRLM